MMKKLLLLLLSFCFWGSTQAGKKPDWVEKRPVDKMSYIGIGFAPKTEQDYMQIAKKQALNDLASEIKIEVQSESLLETVEKDEQVSSYLSGSIRVTAREYLEEFELTDSWEDSENYWVYYRLSKADYQNFKARKKSKAVHDGYSFWVKGIDAQKQGDIFTAAEMFIKGLEAVRPCADEELRCEHNGTTVDVAVELYGALKQLFNGITVTSSPTELDLKAFRPSSTPVRILVAQKGIPLKNIKLQSSFLSGSGQLSADNVTDNKGEMELYIQNITSKAARQEICVMPDKRQFAHYENPIFESAYTSFLNNTPRSIIMINVEQAEHKVYIKNTGQVNEALAASVKNLLVNNFFSVVNDAAQADLLVLLKCDIKKGNVVKGEMYNFNEYYTNVDIQIIEALTSKSLLSYSINDYRTLSPVSTSETAAKNSAVKEVMKQVNKGFKKELDNLNINN